MNEADDPRTWGNCASTPIQSTLPVGNCEWVPSDDPLACSNLARVWRWRPDGGFYPMCYVHAHMVAALDREWAAAEAEAFEQ